MENEIQLNISAPLMTMRKHLSPRAPAVGTVAFETEKPSLDGHLSLLEDISEWESELVRKPIAVPFIWEKVPGRPKGDCLNHFDDEPAITPRTSPATLFDVCTLRPPPGRLVDKNHVASGVCSPRLTSGTLADETHISGEKYMVQDNQKCQVEAFTTTDRASLLESLEENHIAGGVRSPRLTSGTLADETHISGEKYMMQDNRKCQVEAFTTTDHASLLESLKESLDADGESDKDSGDDSFYDALDTLSTNELLSLKSSVSGLSSSYHQNRGSSEKTSADLQTRDFMMSRFLSAEAHTPRHVPKKPTVVILHQKTVNKVTPLKRKSPLKRPGLDARPYSNQHLEYIEIEDEEVESDDSEIRTGKTCGVFQRLCVKNVVSHRNLKSRMKLKTQSSKPSPGEVRKLTKNAYSLPVDKVRYPSEVTSQELPKVFNNLTDKPKQISFSSNIHKMADKLSPRVCPKTREASPVGNKRPPSTFHEGARFLGLPKPIEPKTDEIIPLVKWDEAIIEVSAQRSNKQGFEPLVVAAEKKMHADTLQKKVTYVKFDSSKAERPSKSLTKKFIAGSEAVRDFGSTGMASTSTCNSKIPGVSLIKQKCNHEGNFLGQEEHKGSENLINGPEESDRAVLLPPIHPPSPKTPSESWLSRTLPPIYSQNYSSRPHGDSHLQYVSKNKQPSNCPKFGKVVKSSKIHHDHHVRFAKLTQ